jgi:hypothetical protein
MYQNSAEPCTEPLRAGGPLPQPDGSLHRSLPPRRQPAMHRLQLVPTSGDHQIPTVDTEVIAAYNPASVEKADGQQADLPGPVRREAVWLPSLPADGEALLRELRMALERQTGVPRDPLLSALAHSSWRVRAEAARLLGLSGEPLIDLLLTVLEREGHEGVREAIVWSLGRLLPAFLADERLRSAWLTRLRTTLIALLQADDCWLVREAAAWALGRLGRAAPLGALRQALLSDSDEEVCAAAAQALALSGKRLARAYLLEALEEAEQPFLQETIREALSQLDELLARSEEQERQERQAHRTASPWRQTLLTLRDFLEDRRGSLQEPRVLLTEQGPVLVLWCRYQAKERRLQEVLDALPLDLRTSDALAPLEAAQRSDDDMLCLLGQRLARHCQEPACQEALMLSTTICCQTQAEQAPPGQGYACLRVIIIGVSEFRVDRDTPPVLRELALAWQAITQEAPLCEQDPCELRLWYQPRSGLASQD